MRARYSVEPGVLRALRRSFFFSSLIAAALWTALDATAVAQHPALAYSTMRFMTSSAVDSSGNVYYLDVPVINRSTNSDLVKLGPDGSEIMRVPFPASGGVLAADASGNIFAAGFCSSQCPVATTVFGNVTSGSGYIVKFGPSGSIVFVDQIAGVTNIGGLAIDLGGNIYLTGNAGCGLPTTAGSFQPTCPTDSTAFAARIAASGQQLTYSTFLHGVSGIPVSRPGAIVADASGSAYIAGTFAMSDWPTTPGAFETTCPSGSTCGWILKLKPDGSGLAYSTFLNEGSPAGLAVDGSGQLYVTGTTANPNFPTTPGAAEPTSSLATGSGYNVGFVMKLNAAGSAPVYSSYVNFMAGTSRDRTRIAVDNAGNAYLAGETFNSSNPTVNAIQNAGNGGDVALLKVNPQGSAYSFVSYLGGLGNDDYPIGLGVDAAGNIYVQGSTGSSGSFPATTAPLGGPDRCCWGKQFAVKIVASSSTATPILWSDGKGFNANFVGTVPTGTSATKLVVFSNYGAAAMSVGSFSLNDAQFTQTNNCPASLAPGTSCAVTVVFTPTAAGRFAPTLTAADASGAVLTRYVLDAIATSAVVTASPSSLIFGPQSLGTTSAPQSITITNTGNAVLTFSSITISGDFSASNTCSGQQIYPGGTCVIQVSFAPTATGQRNGSITLTSNAGTTTIALSGGLLPDFTVSASSGGGNSQTVTAGQSATFSLSLLPQAGFTGVVSLSCTGAPAGSNCAANPSSLNLTGTSAMPFTVTVGTTARSTASQVIAGSSVVAVADGARGLALSVAGLLLSLWFSVRRRRWMRHLSLISVVALVAALLGCGGGSSSSPPKVSTGTPAGTYTIVVSATSGSTAHTQNLTLVVN